MILTPRAIAALGLKGFYVHEEAYNSRTTKQLRRAMKKRARRRMRQDIADMRSAPISTDTTNGTGT
ncbi:hypothetical protein OTB20_34235 [Streptomyces sp. H27-H1]|uniref:hypothetical protein n=1 Tax=unclassified Streptomyces TaxID=2593676 RepID=UPI002270685B|nr:MULTISPECIES: hypothetical protein [unclassified Streptomyces]MCY0931155.1 hypothetical protein [Streptomyces sp. H27-H1]MCY0939250.1 hypothetical protein [Streptomyces sp. H34-S4]